MIKQHQLASKCPGHWPGQRYIDRRGPKPGIAKSGAAAHNQEDFLCVPRIRRTSSGQRTKSDYPRIILVGIYFGFGFDAPNAPTHIHE